MNALGHRQAGYLCGISAGILLNYLPFECILVGAIATITSGGKTSPDLDQTDMYNLLLPKAWKGHRKLTHWWGWPAFIWFGILIYWQQNHPDAWWFSILWILTLGWSSHLLIDFIFGDAGYGRGAGIPLSPLGNHRGLLGKKNGLKSDGITAKVTTRLIFPISCVVITLSLFR